MNHWNFLLPACPGRRRSAGIILLILLGSGLLTAQSGTFSGSWRTSLGQLNINIDNGKASGTYRGGGIDGDIEAALSSDGRLLSGYWRTSENGGRFLMRLAASGNSFDGHWYHGDRQKGGQWFGIRENAPVKTAASADDFAGNWTSNYGRMVFSATGDRVSGNYQGAKNNGSITGQFDVKTHKLIASYTESGGSGRLILQVTEAGSGIIGQWWYPDNKYGGYWYGVRPMRTEGAIYGDCQNGGGTYIWADGTRYSGDWKDGFYHGSGTLRAADGRILNRGIWHHGRYLGRCLGGDCIAGEGKLKLPSGDLYEGLFSDGLPEGNGQLTTVDSIITRGEFRRGVLHGPGVLQAGSTIIEGRFRRGVMVGKTTVIFANGDRFEGGMMHGQRHGPGKMVWSNGDSYDGMWQNDQMSGKGTYLFHSGERYSGQFDQGLRHGSGSYIFANGNTLATEWTDDTVREFQTVRDYAGVAGDSGMNRPLILRTARPQPTPLMSGKSTGKAIIAHRLTEQPPASAESPREVTFEYFIIHGPESGDTESAGSALQEQQSIDPANWKLEAVRSVEIRLKNFLNRYRFEMGKTRVNPILRGTIFIAPDR